MRDGFQERPAVGAQKLDVRRRTKQHVLGVIVLPRKLPEQIADVGADPIVMQLSGVDGDPHGARDSIGPADRGAATRV